MVSARSRCLVMSHSTPLLLSVPSGGLLRGSRCIAHLAQFLMARCMCRLVIAGWAGIPAIA